MKNLTLVIPTYNRPAHLARLLAYYQQANLGARFLVLDSSDEATVAANGALVASCGERFRHLVFPSSLAVATKLYQGVELVETPYCAFCADDDLVFPEALAKALDFLVSHDDYVCTDGIYLNFFPSNGEIQFRMEYGSRGIDAEHAGARVFQLFQRYESMFYAVFRTPDLRELFSFVKDIPSLHYQELFQAAGALLKGKSHRLPEFYAARQHCDPAEPARDNWQTFYWFADDTTEFLDHYQAYRAELWKFYERFCAEPRLEQKPFLSAMDMAHATFFSENCPPEYFHSRLQQCWPQDAFKAERDQVSVFDDLKSDRPFTLEKLFYALIKRVEVKAAGYAPHVAQRGLDKQVKQLAKEGLGWRCWLPPDLWWMASVPKFQTAYREVCSYLGKPN